MIIAHVRRREAGLDQGPGQAMSFGVGGTTFTSADQSGAAAAVTDAPPAGKRLVIADLEISCSADMALTFSEETTGVVVGKYYLSANAPLQVTPRGKRKLATAGKRLMVQASVAGAFAVTAHYYGEV